MKKKKVVLGCLFGFLGFLLVIVIVVVVMALNSGIDTENNVDILNISRAVDITKEEAKEINNIFENVGIDNFKSITLDEALNDFEGEGSKGYRIETSFAKNIIMYVVDNKLFSIRWADKDFYKEDKVLLNFADFTMTIGEQSEYQVNAENRIKEILKSPSTAKFPSATNWSINKNNDEVILQSYVDSQNGFGATVRGQFQIKYDKDKSVISLIFDGVEYIK